MRLADAPRRRNPGGLHGAGDGLLVRLVRDTGAPMGLARR